MNKKNLGRLKESYSNLANKVTKIEESVTSAHKRISEHINDCQLLAGTKNE